MRERPRLARPVADVVDAHPDLFTDLAVHGLLERLARLDEPGDAAVHRNRERPAPRQQRVAIVAFDERDDGRRQSRECQQRAVGTATSAFAQGLLGRAAAPAAESVGAVPFDQLHRPPGDSEHELFDLAVQSHQRHRTCAGLTLDAERPAGTVTPKKMASAKS